jgi:hypothetical protein
MSLRRIKHSKALVTNPESFGAALTAELQALPLPRIRHTKSFKTNPEKILPVCHNNFVATQLKDGIIRFSNNPQPPVRLFSP